MNKKPYILLTFLFLFSIFVSAQVETDIIRPSINAAQFGLAVKAETALNKGQLSLNIPLMELQGKGYNLPISLIYYGGDVTSSTEASSVGLGWALMAGGVISVTIKGTDDIDDYSEDWETDHHTDSDYIKNNYRNPTSHFLERIQRNSMPDEYTYSLPGHSGTIELSVENKTIKRTLFPDESYRLEQTDSGYCITADDGTKFYFEDAEQRITGTIPESSIESTSWFLSKIETTKGGFFKFSYASEFVIDRLALNRKSDNCVQYQTKRIKRIESDFGSITFDAESRKDRGNILNSNIQEDLLSKRICKIELKDNEERLIKGYRLDNSSTFELELGNLSNYDWLDSYDWCNCQLKLSSITPYGTEEKDTLPPYKFSYDYRLSKPRLINPYLDTDSKGYYMPYASWTSESGTQIYVSLTGGGRPFTGIGRNQPNSYPYDYTWSDGRSDVPTAEDYFCLNRICYPNGVIDDFTYEPHDYSRINNTRAGYSCNMVGRRLATKMHYGTGIKQSIEYLYKIHNDNYESTERSSGVLTNPSIHNATYYVPEWIEIGGWELSNIVLVYRASRISSGKPLNSFMGQPVCYTEVEEIVKDDADTLSRTIHYFEPQIVEPPVNYILDLPDSRLLKVDNYIYGRKTGYTHGMEVTNDVPNTYIAYPVGEFCNVASVVDLPLKEVFIGKYGDVRSIKEYTYYTRNIGRKYGYKVFAPKDSDHILFSKSAYLTRNVRLESTKTTFYYYNGEECDSITERYWIDYNKGRTNSTCYYRGNNPYYTSDPEAKLSYYYYPDKIQDVANNSSSPTIAAMSELIEKNMIATPIKTVVKQDRKILEGECTDYQLTKDTNMPVLKSLYKIKNTKNDGGEPTIVSDTINYHADLYKEGEILEYDSLMNPVYVRLKKTQDRIYVWGYDGRYPIAVIDNMTFERFESITNLRNEIMKLESLKKIETAEEYADLKNKNLAIRNLLPKDAHITTYTYDPYFGMTSETDDSNLGVIYTYDTFGRLTSKYDTDFNKTEEYNYHYRLQ